MKIRREVIIAGGSIKSPQILQVSGVGPKALSQKIGVTSIVDLPVGENLHDHGTLNLGYNSKLCITCFWMAVWLTMG